VTDRVVSKVLVRDNGLKGLVEGLKICTEKVWLNLSKLIELDKSVLENRLVLLGKSLGHDCCHEGQQLDELLRVLAFCDGQVVGKSLQGSNLNVQFLKVQCSLENATKLLLVLYQVVHNVAEEAVEDEKRRVHLRLVLTLNKCEQQVEQVLPDSIVLFLDHGALDLNSHIAHFVDQSLVRGINALKCLHNGRFHLTASLVGEALPEVSVVILVCQVRRISGLSAHIPAEDDGSEALGLD